jgi:Fic family protein
MSKYMVYIHKKHVGGKTYYTLRTSKRVKGRVITKDIASLGSDPSKIEARLESLSKEYNKDIRKAHRNIKKIIAFERFIQKVRAKKLKTVPILKRELLEEVEAIKLHYQNNFLKEDPLSIEEIYKNFLIGFAYNTASLEGNTITLKEAERLLQEDLTPRDRTLREIHDLKNTEKTFFFLLEEKGNLNHSFIEKIHDDLIENIDKRKGYRYKDIRVVRSNFKSSPGKYVKADMDILLKWYKENKKKLHPIVMAATFHQKFEEIHPFFDGNGRTGRMIMNYMLIQSGFPPIVIQKKNRKEYLNSLGDGNGVDLDKVDEKKFEPLVNFICNEMITSYWSNFLV